MMTVLAREVASGFIIARVGWRFMNDVTDSPIPRRVRWDFRQMIPAIVPYLAP
jgi:hypothetical protein